MTVKQIQHLLEDKTCAEILGKYGPSGDGTNIPERYTNSPRQLALFMVNPMFIIGDPEGSRVGYWLRDVVSATKFSAVTAYGPANETNVTVETGVRPVFAIGSV